MKDKIKRHKNTLASVILISALMTLPILFNSCFAFRIAATNTGNVLFNESQKVKKKIKDPIRDDVKLSALWIGHSSVLLQIEDKVLLIDPVFNEVIGGLMLRKTEAGIDLDDIPKLDLVLISHAHMDHLSLGTLDDINDNDRFKGARVIFPRGVEYFLPDYPELDLVRMETGNSWKKGFVGETRTFDGVKVTTVFTVHFGGRFGFDSYLWNMPGCTGYVIEYKGKTIFYPGDTIYDEEGFKAIGEKFNIDLALIPIGPCRDCMEIDNFNHVTSFGALKMLDDVRAKYMIPVHYGCIQYRNDPDEPLIALREIIRTNPLAGSSGSGLSYNIPLNERVIILDEGMQHVFE